MDIIPWSSDEPTLVKNSMKPAEVARIEADVKTRHATIYVDRSQLSQAIGKGGRNVRLASWLSGWEIDVFELPPQAEEPSQESEETKGTRTK